MKNRFVRLQISPRRQGEKRLSTAWTSGKITLASTGRSSDDHFFLLAALTMGITLSLSHPVFNTVNIESITSTVEYDDIKYVRTSMLIGRRNDPLSSTGRNDAEKTDRTSIRIFPASNTFVDPSGRGWSVARKSERFVSLL